MLLTGGRMKKQGFTLIELMLVLIILATLAGLVIPRIAGRGEQARNTAARAAVLATIPFALDMYELDTGNYPTTDQGLNALKAKPTTPPIPESWNGPYLKKKLVDPWGNSYVYTCPGVNNTGDYDISSTGKDGVDGGGDDLTNWEE